MKMNKTVLAVAAVAEAGTGVILLAYPPIMVRLLFGAEISGTGVIMTRLGGIALIGLGVACWPGDSAMQQIYGMLAYSTLAMLYLIRIGIVGTTIGMLLWPGVVAHIILVALLVFALFRNKTSAAKEL